MSLRTVLGILLIVNGYVLVYYRLRRRLSLGSALSVAIAVYALSSEVYLAYAGGLVRPADAHEIDTSAMSIEQVVDAMVGHVHARGLS